MSPGKLALTNSRSASRKAASSVVKRKSIAPAPLLTNKAGASGDRQRQLPQADDQQQADQQCQDVRPIIGSMLRDRYLGKAKCHQQPDPHRRQEQPNADRGSLDDVEMNRV